MKENAVIFYFRTGVDAFSQKIERSLHFFSDSFVLYSGLRSFRYKVVSIQVVSIQMYMIQCSCHVLLAEFRTSVNLKGFHVFALMHVFAQIFYFRKGGDTFSQQN